jgi:cystathionine beta-lyase family protein involved in aluminum resistance
MEEDSGKLSKERNRDLNIAEHIDRLTAVADGLTEPYKRNIEAISEYNTEKVLQAFIDNGVGEEHLKGTTGYGYNDIARSTLEAVYALIFGTEAAFVRPQLVSGTHAIAACLFGNLRPGDEVIFASGSPYDTLLTVIGKEGNASGTLKDFGIKYTDIPLGQDGGLNIEGVLDAISARTKMIAIQRSCGYDLRPAVTVECIGEITHAIKKRNKDIIVFVDNCYGEFVEKLEPTDVGADLIAGSLIKNPGGGLASSGGYVCGKERFVNATAGRVIAPGLGNDTGPMLNSPRELFQGLFLAPHIVAQALKGSVFVSALFEELGYEVLPRYCDRRSDIVQTIRFDDEGVFVRFCQEIQKASPVDAKVLVVPDGMPGYSDKIIMACGSFIQGASIELSADGPLRPPYICYFQGGLTEPHVRIATKRALYAMLSDGIIEHARLLRTTE